MKFIVENKRRKRVKESADTRNFTIEYVNYNDCLYDTTDTEDIVAVSAKEAIDKFKEDHDEEIVSVYDESDIFYDIDTGIELDESKKVVKEDSYDFDENKDQGIWDQVTTRMADCSKDILGIESEEISEEDWNDLGDVLIRIYKKSRAKQNEALNEAFNPDFPEWITRYLRKDSGRRKGKRLQHLIDQGIDLNAATFTETEPPISGRDPILKDKNRLAVFELVDDKGSNVLWIPGLSSDWGEIAVEDPNYLGHYEYKKIADMSWKWILSHTNNYGFFNLADPLTTARDKRRDRMKAKKGMIDRGTGQYHSKKYGTEDEWQWLETRGQDKSGYKLDPEKYSRMLDNVGLSNYADRLKSYYNKIEEVRSALISIITDADLLKKDYKAKDSFSGNIMGDVRRASDYLSDAIEKYKGIETSIDKWSSKGDLDDSMVSEIFKWNAPSLRKHLQDAVEYIKHMQSNPTYPKDED